MNDDIQEQSSGMYKIPAYDDIHMHSVSCYFSEVLICWLTCGITRFKSCEIIINNIKVIFVFVVQLM